MLVMFRTKNFNSFKDDAILDLRKTNYIQHSNHAFKYKDYELLKTIVIYGANASGKSNLVSAIKKYSAFILQQLFKANDMSREDEKSLVLASPFLLTPNIEKSIEYEMVFYNGGYLFQYGYSIEDEIIKSEWLLVDNKTVFERENTEIKFGNEYKNILNKYNKSREDRLYIGVIDYFVSDKCIVNFMNKFVEFFGVKLNIYTSVYLDVSVKGIFSDTLHNKKIYKDEKFREKVVEYVSKIDVGIKNILVDKKVAKYNDKKQEEFRSYAIHNVYNDAGEAIAEKRFEFDMESSGTIRFISLIEEVILMLQNGGTFIVDELSSRLHPVITKFIVDLFQSEVNTRNSQLIFTTHDISLMNKEQFRRDEIVLVDKNEYGVSSVYALSDLDIRADASFDKDYLKGKYGALPIVKEIVR